MFLITEVYIWLYLLSEVHTEIVCGELFDPHRVILAPYILGVVKAPDSIPLNVVLYRLGGPLFKESPCISSAFTRKSVLHPTQSAAKAKALYLTNSTEKLHSRYWSGNNLKLATTQSFTKAQLRGIIIMDSGL